MAQIVRVAGIDVGLLLGRIHAPRREGDLDVLPGILRGFLDRRSAPEWRK